MTNGSLVDFDGVNEVELGNSRNLIDRLGAQNFATNTAKKILVLTNSDGVYLSRLDRVTELPIRLVAGNGFLPPVVDVNGFIWIVPADAEQNLIVFNSQGQRINFSSNWLAGVNRLSFSISSEGSRIVAVTGSRIESRVRVAALVRTSEGAPEALGEPFSPMQTNSAFMATWVDSTEIGVLESPDSVFTQPWISVIGGDSRRLQTISGGREMVSSGQAASVYIVDDFDTLFQYRGSNWTRLRENIDAFHFPGN
jgi:hypothetical protein